MLYDKEMNKLNEIDLKEIDDFWSIKGECQEVDDIVSLREMAYTDIYNLISIIKVQEMEVKQYEKLLPKWNTHVDKYNDLMEERNNLVEEINQLRRKCVSNCSQD